ncbi:MAG: cytochrome c [Gallionellaceae bacterium]|nr:cytochrome c [Gallionellaceae bacterium]
MKIVLSVFLLLCGIAQAVPFTDGDAKAGKKLFEHYKCNSCHIGKMGGDGSAIFTRANHKVTSPEKMIAQIKMCSGNVGANLSAQEEQNLAAYLNQKYYKFK